MSANTPLRVVIADDDASARRVIKYALEAVGITVVAEAMDGREAVELGLRHRPDIVVIDVVMPRLDGILATRRILEADPGQLVVVLTGVGEDELGLEALRAGAVDVVPKDADLDVLARALERATHENAAISRAAGQIEHVAKALEHVDERFGDSADIVVYEPLEGGEARKGSLAKHAGGGEEVGHASHRGPMRDDVSMALPVRLDHCVIHISDWDVSNAFYRDVVGAELVETGGRLAYRFGAQQLNLHGPGVSPAQVARLPVQPGNSDLCFAWAGPIEDAVAHLEACGVAVELGPVERSGAKGTGRSVYFRDPDGSLLEFIAYAQRAADERSLRREVLEQTWVRSASTARRRSRDAAPHGIGGVGRFIAGGPRGGIKTAATRHTESSVGSAGGSSNEAWSA